MPGSMAPVPRLPSGPSPAPTTTGVPGGSPTAAAVAGASGSVDVVGRIGGSLSMETPQSSMAVALQSRVDMSSRPVPDAGDSSVTTSPVKPSSRYSLSPTHQRAA